MARAPARRRLSKPCPAPSRARIRSCLLVVLAIAASQAEAVRAGDQEDEDPVVLPARDWKLHVQAPTLPHVSHKGARLQAEASPKAKVSPDAASTALGSSPAGAYVPIVQEVPQHVRDQFDQLGEEAARLIPRPNVRAGDHFIGDIHADPGYFRFCMLSTGLFDVVKANEHEEYPTAIVWSKDIHKEDSVFRVFILGDMVDGGPDSLYILNTLYHLSNHRDLGDRLIVLLGNHELYLLTHDRDEAVGKDRFDMNKRLRALRGDPVKNHDAKVITWLAQQRLMYVDEDGKFLASHGGMSWYQHEYHALEIAGLLVNVSDVVLPQGIHRGRLVAERVNHNAQEFFTKLLKCYRPEEENAECPSEEAGCNEKSDDTVISGCQDRFKLPVCLQKKRKEDKEKAKEKDKEKAKEKDKEKAKDKPEEKFDPTVLNAFKGEKLPHEARVWPYPKKDDAAGAGVLFYRRYSKVKAGAGQLSNCLEAAFVAHKMGVRAMVAAHSTHQWIGDFCRELAFLPRLPPAVRVFMTDVHRTDCDQTGECDRPLIEDMHPSHFDHEKGNVPQSLRLVADANGNDYWTVSWATKAKIGQIDQIDESLRQSTERNDTVDPLHFYWREPLRFEPGDERLHPAEPKDLPKT